MTAMVGKRGINSKDQKAVKEAANFRKDVEDGRPQQDRKYRFRDQSTNLDPDDQRRVEFKKLLLEGVDTADLEKYRKSDEEVMLRCDHGLGFKP